MDAARLRRVRREAMLSYDVLRTSVKSGEVWGPLIKYAASLLDASLVRGSTWTAARPVAGRRPVAACRPRRRS